MAGAGAEAVAVAVPLPRRRIPGRAGRMTFSLGPDLGALFMLVFARVGTLVMLLPALGERFFPTRVRLLLGLFLTFALLPVVRPLFPATLDNLQVVLSLLGFELGVGLMIGLCGRLVVASLQTAGNFVAQALGLAFAETVDPTQGGQAAAIGNFLTLLGITLLFATDAHHVVIGAIRGSYASLPPGMTPPTGDAATLAVSTMGRGFAVAVQIAAPFIAFGIVFNLGLGVLARLMPQLQVFFLGVPATILIGFVVLAAVVGVMMNLFLGEVRDFLFPFAR
jgi:flagellar biosynthetic protein FliR